MECEDCSLYKFVPKEELKDWIHDLKNTQDEVKMIKHKIDSKKTTSTEAWIGICITVIIFVTTAIYSVGGIHNDIKSQKETIDKVEKETDELRQAVVEIQTMAQDIKDIKHVIFQNVHKTP